MDKQNRRNKMKRILFLLVFVAVAGIGMLKAAAPVGHGYVTTIDTISITTQFETKFMVVDSLITVTTDSALVMYVVSGIAVLDPNERLYVGFGNDSANCVDSATCAGDGQANSNIDTIITHAPLGKLRGKTRVPFSFTTVITIVTQTDITDTMYVNMTTGSSTSNIEIEDFVFTAHVTDKE